MQEKKKLVNISINIYTTYFGFLTKKKKKKLTKIKPSWQVEKQKRTYHKISSSTTECCTNERLWYCPIKLRPIQGSDRPPPGVSLSALCSLQQGCKWTTCKLPCLTNLMAILFVHSLIFFSNTSLFFFLIASAHGVTGDKISQSRVHKGLKFVLFWRIVSLLAPPCLLVVHHFVRLSENHGEL